MTLRGFVHYVMQFYGEEGLYPETLPGISRAEIVEAVAELALAGHDFAHGDTWDREVVRDCILKARAEEVNT